MQQVDRPSEPSLPSFPLRMDDEMLENLKGSAHTATAWPDGPRPRVGGVGDLCVCLADTRGQGRICPVSIISPTQTEWTANSHLKEDLAR